MNDVDLQRPAVELFAAIPWEGPWIVVELDPDIVVAEDFFDEF
jgi:hypothetical protein